MVLIQLLLPTTTAGRGDSTAAITETRRELSAKFDGLTAYMRSPAKGVWTAADGHTELDDVVMVEVVTDIFDRKWWREYSAALATRFAQDAIHVRALSIELIEEGE